MNESRDVLYVVIEGSVELTVDGEPNELRQGDALIVPKGARRALAAGRHASLPSNDCADV